MSLPRVKICGLTRREDAQAAVAAGASFLGVILAPGGKRTLSPEHAGEVLAALPATRVGVFVDAEVEEMQRSAVTARLDVLQLHGDETPETARALREAGWTVWKALRPRGGAEFTAGVARWAGAVDALLLDGWSPEAHGGTGASFPWREIAALRGRVPEDLALVVAGGLRPENVVEAAELLRPGVVDVSSGVESAPGIKDHDAIRAFVAAARGGS